MQAIDARIHQRECAGAHVLIQAVRVAADRRGGGRVVGFHSIF